MGADLLINERRPLGIFIDKDKFVLGTGGEGDISVVDCRPKDRHLLLKLQMPSINVHKPIVSKLLCGHDERHWFAAEVPRSASNVNHAMQTLKPAVAIRSQQKAGVKADKLNKRHNKGYIRQGEWFFIPTNIFDKCEPFLVFKNEPFRSTGKNHFAEFLARDGGTLVYVNNTLAPNGITEREFNRLSPQVKKHGWTTMTRNAAVYVKGRIRHQDHSPVHLKTWCRVELNREIRGGRFNGFLD